MVKKSSQPTFQFQNIQKPKTTPTPTWNPIRVDEYTGLLDDNSTSTSQSQTKNQTIVANMESWINNQRTAAKVHRLSNDNAIQAFIPPPPPPPPSHNTISIVMPSSQTIVDKRTEQKNLAKRRIANILQPKRMLQIDGHYTESSSDPTNTSEENTDNDHVLQSSPEKSKLEENIDAHETNSTTSSEPSLDWDDRCDLYTPTFVVDHNKTLYHRNDSTTSTSETAAASFSIEAEQFQTLRPDRVYRFDNLLETLPVNLPAPAQQKHIKRRNLLNKLVNKYKKNK